MPAAQKMLLSAPELAAALADSEADVVTVDCRFDLMNPESGQAAWRKGHIAGARYADLDKDLASARTPHSGRHPLPDPQKFAELLGSWGVTPETLIVAYDNVGGAIAARLWWLLGWAGHEHAGLLDGGLQAWEAGGYPLHTDQPELASGKYPLKPDSLPDIDAGRVLSELEANALALIDARDPVRFAGDAEPIDPVAGHIPGALNRPFSLNLDEQKRFKAPELLRTEFAQLMENKPQEVAVMCGSGVTACHHLFAMQLAGIPAGRLYVGSWSEWITDPDRPVVRNSSS